jgi:hypothetical protein
MRSPAVYSGAGRSRTLLPFWYKYLFRIAMPHSCGTTIHPHRLRTVYEPLPARPAAKPTHAEIARLAYSYWEARGPNGGSALEDWLRAERELTRPR